MKFSNSQLNAAIKQVIAATGTLSQACKVFGGIYSATVKVGKGDNEVIGTVADVLEDLGIQREVKNGKLGEVTPKSVVNAWHSEMKVANETGGATLKMWRKENAYVVRSVFDAETGKSKDVRFPVYTRNEAAKVNQKRIAFSRYNLFTVKGGNWAAATILKGVKQGIDYDSHLKKHETAEKAWNGFCEKGGLCIVEEQTLPNGGIKHAVVPVNAKDVCWESDSNATPETEKASAKKSEKASAKKSEKASAKKSEKASAKKTEKAA